MPNPKIIGISGVTCAGKTTFAQRLVNYFGTKCVLLSQDEFYRPEDDLNHEWVQISPGVRHQNWEAITSIDWQSFSGALNRILDETVCDQSVERIVVIEGHLIFNYRPISELCHKKFFLTLDKKECLERRNARIYLAKDPPGYFECWVWPMFLKNFDQMKELQNEIPIEFLDAKCDQNVMFNTFIKSLKQLDS